MTVREAKDVAECVPNDLSALQFFSRPSVGPTACLCAVGDIGLSGRVAVRLENGAPNQLFGELAPFLRTADITFGNLETALASDLASGNKMFAGSVSGAALLVNSGFDIINLANNHIADYGKPGLAATLQAVSEAKMMPLGTGHTRNEAQQVLVTEANGLQVGWLGCGRTLVDQEEGGPFFWEFNEKELQNAVERAHSDVDVLIVSIHIGFMYMDYPHPDHKRIAEKLMGAGADLILMHHAHVLQGVQVTAQERVCCYNLGNFLFDRKEGRVKTPIMEKEQDEGAIFLFTIDKQGVAQAMALPTWIDEDCGLHWATGTRGQEILGRLSRISQDLEGDFVPAFRRQRSERNAGHVFKVLLFDIREGNWAFVLESFRRIRLEHVSMGIRFLGEVLKQIVKERFL
jgi:poly-gamma-glutamate synthesis protein (capsule biosynthesis protein)